ncbi:MAG: ABC transporter permease [Candidatus Omnitrophota bacterium]
MNITRVKALCVKEFIHVARDVRSLGLAIAIPMLLLILFGYALTLDVDNVPVVIWNQDGSRGSADFIRLFDSSRYFRAEAYYDNYDDLVDSIDSKKALMAFVIPKNFSGILGRGGEAPFQVIVDGTNANTATIAMSYVQAIVTAFNKRALIKYISMSGGKTAEPLDMRARVWFNPDLKSRNYIIPGLIAVIMMVIAALLTSLTIAREWERGTMEQLISTPVTSQELILGKFFPYFVIGMIDVLIAVLMGEFMFHVPLCGSVALLFTLSCVFLTGALCLGFLISIFTRNQFFASQVAFIATFLPSFLLSGFAFPIENMPPFIQALTHVIPTRYFVVILKGIYLKGVGLAVLAPQVFFLIIFSLITVFLANLKFKKKVS